MVADNLSVIVMTKQRGTARRTSLALLAPSPTNQPTDRPTDRAIPKRRTCPPRRLKMESSSSAASSSSSRYDARASYQRAKPSSACEQQDHNVSSKIIT
jgi:hypothetical protein